MVFKDYRVSANLIYIKKALRKIFRFVIGEGSRCAEGMVGLKILFSETLPIVSMGLASPVIGEKYHF